MPTLAMLLAVSCWSLSVIGNKLMLAFFQVMEVAAYRFGLACLALSLALALRREIAGLFKAGIRPALLGVMEPGLVSFFVLYGLTMTSATHAAVLWAMVPVVSPVFARIILGEPLRRINLAGAGFAFAGTVMLISNTGNPGTAAGNSALYGDLLCLVGVFISSAMSVLARRIATGGGAPLVTTTLQVGSGALTSIAVIAVLAIATGNPPTDPMSLTVSQTAIVLGFGIGTGTLPFLLYNYAIRHMPVGRITLFVPLNAPFGAAFSALFLGEQIRPMVILAIALVMTGAMLPTAASYLKRR